MCNCSFEVFDNISEGIVLLDMDFNIVYWNIDMVNITDISKEEAFGKKIYNVLPRFGEKIFEKSFNNIIKNNQKFFFSAALHKEFIATKKNKLCPIRQNLKISAFSKDEKKYILMEFIDVTSEYIRIKQMKNYIKNLKKLEENLEKSEEKYRLLFENMDKGFLHTMVVVNNQEELEDLIILDINKILLKVLGLGKAQVLEESAIFLFERFINRREDIEKILNYAKERKTLRMDEVYIRQLKKTVQISGYSSGLNTYGFIITDITDQKKNEEIIKNLAYFDHLTRLYNRKIFLDNVEELLKIAKEEEAKCALMILDLDDFKEINDNYGHYVGDIVLRTVSDRIIKNIRSKDLACRYGGDELLIFTPNVNSSKDINNIACRIVNQIKKPIKIKDKIIDPSVSVGISVYPDNGENIDDLLIRADENLYKVKYEGGGSYKI